MPSSFLDFSVQIALLFLSATFLITVFKVIKGPTLPDRVLALDLLVAAAIGFTAVLGIKTGFTLYLDIAIALGLVGFLATVAFARFILARGQTEETEGGDVQPSIEAKEIVTESKAPAQKQTASKKTSTKRTSAPKPKTKKASTPRKTTPKAKS